MRGEHYVLRAGEQCGPDGDGFMPAAGGDSAYGFPLPVELAFYAVFKFAHHGHLIKTVGHVIKTLVRQGGVGAALVGSVPSDDLDGAHWGYYRTSGSDIRAGSTGSFGGL